MINRSRFPAAMFVVAALTMFIAAGSANAGVPWACPATSVCNFSGCTVQLRLRATPGAVFNVNLPPGACAFINTAAVTSIDFVVSAGGVAYGVQPPPAIVPLNCAATNWWVNCVTLAPGCCCDVCFDQANCRININPAACVGPCRP